MSECIQCICAEPVSYNNSYFQDSSQCGYTQNWYQRNQYGIPLEQTDKKGHTALFRAIHYGHIKCMKKLINARANIDCYAIDGVSPCLEALNVENRVEVLKMLINAKANINIGNCICKCSLVLAAVRGSYTECLKILIDAKADMNSGNRFMRSPLHKACYLQDNECIKILIESKAQINIIDNEGETPIFIAAYNNNIEGIEMLIEAKSNINIKTNNGLTPFLLACTGTQRNEQSINLLLDEYYKEEISLNEGDKWGTTPLMMLTIARDLYIEKTLQNLLDISDNEIERLYRYRCNDSEINYFHFSESIRCPLCSGHIHMDWI